MSDAEILGVLTRVIQNLLFDDSIALTMATRREDVPNWDSCSYVNFIVAVEIELGVRFKVADVESFQNVGEIVSAAKAMLL